MREDTLFAKKCPVSKTYVVLHEGVITFKISVCTPLLQQFVVVSCGYDTCFAVKACDGLCHLTKIMDRVGNFVRHTVGRCLIFPALREVAKVTWATQAIKSRSIQVASSSSIPTGQYGLSVVFQVRYLYVPTLTAHILGSDSGSP